MLVQSTVDITTTRNLLPCSRPHFLNLTETIPPAFLGLAPVRGALSGLLSDRWMRSELLVEFRPVPD